MNIIHMKKCINCGKMIPDYARYCAFCRQNQEKAPSGNPVDLSAMNSNSTGSTANSSDSTANSSDNSVQNSVPDAPGVPAYAGSSNRTRNILIAVVACLSVVIVAMGVVLYRNGKQPATSDKVASAVADDAGDTSNDSTSDETEANDSNDTDEESYDDSDDENSDDEEDYDDENYDDSDNEDYDDDEDSDDDDYADENLDGSVDDLTPDFSSKIISDSYIDGLSDDQLQLVINTLYASKGYHFKAKNLNDYFSSKSWYTDDGITDMTEIADSLNDTEYENLQNLAHSRDDR